MFSAFIKQLLKAIKNSKLFQQTSFDLAPEPPEQILPDGS
jgi:hypothetical protein